MSLLIYLISYLPSIHFKLKNKNIKIISFEQNTLIWFIIMIIILLYQYDPVPILQVSSMCFRTICSPRVHYFSNLLIHDNLYLPFVWNSLVEGQWTQKYHSIYRESGAMMLYITSTASVSWVGSSFLKS
jgi:hypothetical protein